MPSIRDVLHPLILKFSKCNMFVYVYKIINLIYFILYQVLLFYFISSLLYRLFYVYQKSHSWVELIRN